MRKAVSEYKGSDLPRRERGKAYADVARGTAVA